MIIRVSEFVFMLSLAFMCSLCAEDKLPAIMFGNLKISENSEDGFVLSAEMNDINPALNVSWGVGNFKYFELLSPQKAKLTNDSQSIGGNIVMDICTEYPQVISGFAIRLIDNTGEVFQIRYPSTLSNGKWQTKVFPLRFNGIKEFWGGNKNGRIDFPVKLYSIVTSFYPSFMEAGSISFHNICYIQSNVVPNKLNEISVRVATDRLLPIVFARKEKAKIVLINTSEYAMDFMLYLNVTDFYYNTVSFDRCVHLASGENKEFVLPDHSQKGIYYVDYILKGMNNTLIRHGQASFARMSPAGRLNMNNKEFLFGVNVHCWSSTEAQHKSEVEAAYLCGAKIVRTSISPLYIMPHEGVAKWERMDKIINDYYCQGITTQALLSYSPKWAIKDKKMLEKPAKFIRGLMPRLDIWNDFVRKAATRYSGKVFFWEIWNEPDLQFWSSTVEEYIQLLKNTYEILKDVSPKNIVMTGGFSNAERNPQFIQKVIIDASGNYDMIAWHKHGIFESFENELNYPLNQIRYDANRPVFFNETGMHSVRGGEREQSKTLFKKLIFSWAWGAKGYSWYDLRNDGLSKKDCEHNYGLISYECYPKAAYLVYNTLASNLGNASCLGRIAGIDYDGIYVYAFKAPDCIIIASWLNKRNVADQYFVVNTNAIEVKELDLMGNATALEVKDNKVVLHIGEPKLFCLRHATGVPKFIRPLFDIKLQGAAMRGQKLKVTTAIYNPDKASQKFGINYILPNSKSVKHQIDIDALSQMDLEHDILVPEQIQSDEFKFRVKFQMLPRLYNGTIDIVAPIAKVIPKTINWDRPPDFDLKGTEKIFDIYAHDPNKAHLLWKDNEDLRGKVWLTCNSENLTLRVLVSDNKHNQPYSGSEIYKGDSLQIGIALPGTYGFWEIGVARSKKGKALMHIWSAPKNMKPELSSMTINTQKHPTGIEYIVRMSINQLGLTERMIAHGFGFNLAINDNDGECRKCWAEIADGIVRGKKSNKFKKLIAH